MDEYQRLGHSKWDCKYQVPFIPKCRRKTSYQELRRRLGDVFRRLAEQSTWLGSMGSANAISSGGTSGRYFPLEAGRCLVPTAREVAHLAEFEPERAAEAQRQADNLCELLDVLAESEAEDHRLREMKRRRQRARDAA